MPYLYSKFRETSETGIPISRCLCIDSPFDANVYDPKYQYEFLFGDGLLLNPMKSKETSKTTYLPEGDWYDFFSDKRLSGGHAVSSEYPTYRIPIFVRAGSIIPLQSQVYSTREKPSDTLYVHVYYGTVNHRLVYYEDDGNSLDYQHGDYYQRNIDFDPLARQIKFGKPEGNYATHFKTIALILHGFDTQKGFTSDGEQVEVRAQASWALDPLADLEDLYIDKELLRTLREEEAGPSQKVLVVGNASEIVISWE